MFDVITDDDEVWNEFVQQQTTIGRSLSQENRRELFRHVQARTLMELGRRAWPLFYASFMKLWKKHGTQPRYARIPEDFDSVVANGGAVAGSPGTIRNQVGRMVGEAGASYFIAQFSFGDLSQQEVLHSAGIFAREVLAAPLERIAQAV